MKKTRKDSDGTGEEEDSIGGIVKESLKSTLPFLLLIFLLAAFVGVLVLLGVKL